jgi:hypothetical protein
LRRRGEQRNDISNASAPGISSGTSSRRRWFRNDVFHPFVEVDPVGDPTYQRPSFASTASASQSSTRDGSSATRSDFVAPARTRFGNRSR